jgi:peptidoglycan/LPS O-acetylase OafA/YrhL
MTNALSLYLDALRFGAAFTVFLSHFAVGRISGGLFWQVGVFGRSAVLFFFVLSGFVIAWATETKERDLQDYALSRIARLYSVIIPAFIVTGLLDHFAGANAAKSSGVEWDSCTSRSVLHFALSAVFLGESWNLAVLPGCNVPFWSLNYEAWYYVLFGAAAFFRGGRRAAALVVAALLAGPKVLILFPVWLMGVAAWQWRGAPPGRVGPLLVILSLTAFIGLEALGGQRLFWRPGGDWLPPDYSGYDYVLGVLAALLILGLCNARLPMPGARVQRLIRWLAGTSFGLYLLHYPLLNFFATIVPGSPAAATHRVLVFGFALGGALALARAIEPQKGALKRRLRSAIDAVAGKRSPPALEHQKTS